MQKPIQISYKENIKSLHKKKIIESSTFHLFIILSRYYAQEEILSRL